jgi:hypothetical protein
MTALYENTELRDSLIGLAGFILFFLFVCYLWIKDLLFYSKHDWDFSKDNGVRGVGPSADSFPAPYEYSPKTRVTVLYPALLIVTFLIILEGVWQAVAEISSLGLLHG